MKTRTGSMEMRIRMRKRILWTVAGLVLLVGVAWFALDREQPADTRYTGAYRFDDGTLTVIGPRDTTDLRFKFMNGDTGALWPTDENGNFEGGEGWAERQPVTNRVQFQRDGAGKVTGLGWQRSGGVKSPGGNAIRVPLRDEIVTFPSGELTLRGKLILPEGQGPFPVMIPVHGSEDYDAEHGITRFKQKDGGERVTVGYEDGYLRQQLEWYRKQSGLL